jgi:hypothetical protein
VPIGRALGHDRLVADTDALWGGILTAFAVDLLAAEVRLSVDVTEAEASIHYLVTLQGVSALRLDRSDPHEWDYIEVTEVHVAEDAAGTEVELILWVEPNGLTVRCSTVRVEVVRT